jgi:hypothetical protein
LPNGRPCSSSDDVAPIMVGGGHGVAETVGTYARPHPMPIGKSAYRKSQAVSERSLRPGRRARGASRVQIAHHIVPGAAFPAQGCPACLAPDSLRMVVNSFSSRAAEWRDNYPSLGGRAPPIAHDDQWDHRHGLLKRHRLHMIAHRNQALAHGRRRLPQSHPSPINLKSSFWIGRLDLAQEATKEFPESS